MTGKFRRMISYYNQTKYRDTGKAIIVIVGSLIAYWLLAIAIFWLYLTFKPNPYV